MSVQQQEPNIQQRIYDLEQQRQRLAAGRAGADAVEKAAKGTHPGFDRIRDCTILSANVQSLPGEQKPGMTKETLLENLRLWGESIYLQISALAATYGLFASAYVVFSIIVGERFAPIAVLNNFAHLITLGGLVTLIVVAATPYRRFWAAYSLPAALAFVVWFGPLFLPNISRKPPSGSSELTVATYNTTYRADDYDEMLRVVLALDADVVGIEEASEEFVDATRQEYPYRWQDANFALISRYPIDRAGIHFLVNEEKNRLDTLVAPIDFDGQPVSVYVFHPIRPSLRIRPLLYDSVDREEATQELADAVEHDPNPVVLLCDCNFAYRTDDYRSIAALLTDGWRERGFGFGFTAPVRSPNLPLGRTDCIWHSSDFVTTSIRVGRENGPSDHFPLRATLALMPSADQAANRRIAGITRSTLSDIENGKTPTPTAETLHAFQQAVAQRGGFISDSTLAKAKLLSRLPYGGERDPFFIDFESWYVTLSDPDKRQVRIYLDSLRNLIEHFSGRATR